MKQFNLEEYLANPSRKVVTRDGRTVKIHCTNYDSRQPIIAELEYHNFSSSFTKDGRYFNDDRNSPYDLFFAPEKHESWTPVYREYTGQIRFGYAYSTKKEAEEASKYDTRYVTTTKNRMGGIGMKPFNLEAYLKNPNKKVVTRDGRDVRIICKDTVSEKGYPLVVLVMKDGHEFVHTYNMYGQFYTADTNHDLDLFFAPEKHEGWVNIYPGPFTGVVVYKSEEDAKHCANANAKVIATVKIEWEE